MYSRSIRALSALSLALVLSVAPAFNVEQAHAGRFNNATLRLNLDSRADARQAVGSFSVDNSIEGPQTCTTGRRSNCNQRRRSRRTLRSEARGTQTVNTGNNVTVIQIQN